MKIYEFNSCNYGSTGNIMLQIADAASESGYQVYTCVPKSKSNSKKDCQNQIFIGNRLSRNVHLLLSKWTGLNGCFSVLSTLSFLRKIDRNRPNLIHLHNLHNSYINLPLLFRYIKKYRIPVVWTLHDCWSFTGQCPHFTLVKCDKWKTGCHECPSYREYPHSQVDRTKTMWKLKKKWFIGVENLTIVTPSQWLADLVKQSYLKEYSVKVINNGIDLDVFKPTPSNFREKYNIPENKFILLGVAFGWGRRKGLDVFVELSKHLDGSKYQIVLVGTDDTVDKQLPDNIISIHRTQNQAELAEIYTAADLFVNPTREENYPTVNMESIACGTPVITFRTGGSPEIVSDYTGTVVECDDINGLEGSTEKLLHNMCLYRLNCLEQRIKFDKKRKYNEYIDVYSDVMDNLGGVQI